MSNSQAFPKNEHLTSKKLISALFEQGKSKRFGHLRLLHLQTDLPSPIPLQILISVPKKNLGKAVHRNKMKRRIREAIRREKSDLTKILESGNKQVAIAIVYNDMRLRPYRTILDNLTLVLAYLIDEYGENGHSN